MVTRPHPLCSHFSMRVGVVFSSEQRASVLHTPMAARVSRLASLTASHRLSERIVKHARRTGDFQIWHSPTGGQGRIPLTRRFPLYSPLDQLLCEIIKPCRLAESHCFILGKVQKAQEGKANICCG